MRKAVLFIDDYEPASAIMQFIVEDMGHVFHYAQTSDEAKIIVKQERIDIALIDINLPKMQGDVLADIIKTSSANPKIFLVGYSADVQSLNEEQRKKFDKIAVKSLAADETATLIESIIAETQQAA